MVTAADGQMCVDQNLGIKKRGVHEVDVMKKNMRMAEEVVRPYHSIRSLRASLQSPSEKQRQYPKNTMCQMRQRVDRIASASLVEALLDLDGAPWAEWRGVEDDQQPRKLTQATLASLLKAFHIRPRSIWLARRTADSNSRKGYYTADFEAAWQAYCPRDGTPAQPNVFKILRND
jgi:hypothetical protein